MGNDIKKEQQDNNKSRISKPERSRTVSHVRKTTTSDIHDMKKFMETKYKNDNQNRSRRTRLRSDLADSHSAASIILGDDDSSKSTRKFKSRMATFWKEYEMVIGDNDDKKMLTSSSKSMNNLSTFEKSNELDNINKNNDHVKNKKMLKESRSRTINPKVMRREKRMRVLAEIVDSERLYYKFLDIFLYKFIIPIRCIRPDEASTLFCNLESIIPFHKIIVDEMETKGIIPVLLEYSAYLRLYTPYVNNYEKAIAKFARMVKHDKKFQEVLEQAHADSDCGGLRFLDFLIMPVQRIPRYRLLLEELKKYTENGTNEMTDLEQTLTKILQIAEKVNESKRNLELMNKVVDVQRRISGDFDLLKQGRVLILEGEQKIWYRSKKKKAKSMHLFLFNDILLWTSPAPNYKYKGVLRLVQCNTSKLDDDENNFAISCHEMPEDLIIETLDWYNAISKTINTVKENTMKRKQRTHKRRNDVHSKIASQLAQLSARTKSITNRPSMSTTIDDNDDDDNLFPQKGNFHVVQDDDSD